MHRLKKSTVDGESLSEQMIRCPPINWTERIIREKFVILCHPSRSKMTNHFSDIGERA